MTPNETKKTFLSVICVLALPEGKRCRQVTYLRARSDALNMLTEAGCAQVEFSAVYIGQRYHWLRLVPCKMDAGPSGLGHCISRFARVKSRRERSCVTGRSVLKIKFSSHWGDCRWPRNIFILPSTMVVFQLLFSTLATSHNSNSISKPHSNFKNIAPPIQILLPQIPELNLQTPSALAGSLTVVCHQDLPILCDAKSHKSG